VISIFPRSLMNLVVGSNYSNDKWLTGYACAVNVCDTLIQL